MSSLPATPCGRTGWGDSQRGSIPAWPGARCGPLSLHALPADTFVDARHAARIGDANQIDDRLSVDQALRDVAEFRRRVADDDGACVIEDLIDARDHQPRDMREVFENESRLAPWMLASLTFSSYMRRS